MDQRRGYARSYHGRLREAHGVEHGGEISVEVLSRKGVLGITLDAPRPLGSNQTVRLKVSSRLRTRMKPGSSDRRSNGMLVPCRKTSSSGPSPLT